MFGQVNVHSMISIAVGAVLICLGPYNLRRGWRDWIRYKNDKPQPTRGARQPVVLWLSMIADALMILIAIWFVYSGLLQISS
jgi:hypothetical protein